MTLVRSRSSMESTTLQIGSRDERGTTRRSSGRSSPCGLGPPLNASVGPLIEHWRDVLRIAITAALLCSLLGCASAAERRASAQASLDNAKTMLELTQLVGVAPTRCMPLTSTSQLCNWEINNRMPGYESLAELAGTDNLVYLICDLPAENAQRKEGSCQVRAVK